MYLVSVRNGLTGLVLGTFAMLLPVQVFSQDTDTLSESRVNRRAVSQLGASGESEAERSLYRLPVSRPHHMTDPFPRMSSRLIEIDMPGNRVRITQDSLGYYTAQREMLDLMVGFPRRMDFETFTALSFQDKIHNNWIRLVEEKRRQRDARRGLLDFTLDLPVGERSAFTTIFGRPEVNLRVSGTANMNVGASIRDTEDPAIPPDQQRRIDPTFEQNLRLNIQGSIGDKLRIQTDWDTERSFDFENRLSIRYSGYEDEIIQSIEMGNVSMQTGNSLISGGSALFGIKSEAKFGPLSLTSVISQREGQGNSQTVTGGAQESSFSIQPSSYENDRHFFLDFYAWQEFEESMSDPQIARYVFSNISDLEVYVLNTSSQERPGQRRAAALVDLAVVENGNQYQMPDEALDPFDEELLEQFRNPDVTPSSSDFEVSSDEFVEGRFVPLERGEEYNLNEQSGFISLNTRLNPDQALAVRYTYTRPDGSSVEVGDVNLGDDRRMFLKLLRPSNMTTGSNAWVLTMRNIYSLNATNLRPEDLEIDIVFDGGNTEQTNLPGLGNILMQDLGLDRVNSQGQTQPDNQIDFGTGTLDAARGRIIFPFLEPFGQRIIEIYEASGLPGEQIDEYIDNYAFTDLYNNTQEYARQRSGNNLYLLKGTSTGVSQDSYNLGYALVEGSVRVMANGVELSEGIDYDVDYSIGNITITNDRYLQSGQEIRIDYESNQMLQIQQTTFAGLRAEYRVSDNIQFGSTYFNLRERPFQDKIPVGDEPINNSIIGVDGAAEFDAPWLTRAINWIPLLQTRADSDISISGEFAQLRPDLAQTRAVSRAMDQGNLYSDEESGLSFIDDFEGSKTRINFLSPGRWNLAAAPHAIPGYDPDMDLVDNSLASRISRSDMRGQFSWYMIPINVGRVTDAERTPESLPISVSDVFPNRQVLRQEDRLQTLDIHYNPRKRGPYNYNGDLRDLLENRPEDTWGGMTATLPSGLDNLRQNNIEFLEFWVQPLLPDGRTPSSVDLENYEGKIYVDLGLISEDVIPNNDLNTEDGMARAIDRNGMRVDGEERSYVHRADNLTGQFSVENMEREDVGLDGAHSTEGEHSEQILFADWLELMETQYADQPGMLEQILADPSNDKYYYFNNSVLDQLPLHERFHRMYGFLEGNSISSGESRANTNRPNTEGLRNPATVNLENSYYQFEIPMNPADTTTLQIGSNYIVDQVDGAQPTDRWYQVRIPLRDIAREVGTIEDLERVSHIRLWMSGYREPLTMRFATFELVGNQWRNFEELALEGDPSTIFEIATVNIEENSNRQPIPYRIPNGAIRSIQRGQQEQILANEQSLSLRVENLGSGEMRMIQRLYPSGLNLLNYSNLRMFVHGEGYENRSDVEVVIRLGNDLSNNYYEYRQPVSPTDPGFNFTPLSQNPDASILDSEADRIWLPDSNGVNIVLGSLNALKQARELQGVPGDELYERSDLVQDAPPGTVIAVRGNPSLDRIREIGIGIRNPHANGTINGNGGKVTQNSMQGVPSLNAELWVNEVRVSGFDDQKGWAANLRTSVRLADFATLNANLNRKTDGFGPLDASLGNRQLRDEYSYDLSTNVNMHRFIPERYGWNFPVSLSARRSQATPRFLPREGDIRFIDFREAVEASDLSEEEMDLAIRQMLQQIRTQRTQYSINLSNLTKNNSESTMLRHTLDNMTLGYVYNFSESSSPTSQYTDSWDYRLTTNYRLNVRNVNIIRPLLFLEDVPVLNWISNTGFTYVPSQISLGGTLDRRYREELRRTFTNDSRDVLQRHDFDFRYNISVNYNLIESISTSFSNQSQLNLQPLGEIPADTTLSASKDFNLVPTFEALESWFLNPAMNPRRSSYGESWSASWRPRLNRIEGLDWFNYSTSFRGQFGWQNSPEGSGLGSSINNSFSWEQNPELRTQTLMRKIPFYDRAIRVEEQARRDRQRQRVRRENNTEVSEEDQEDFLKQYGRRLILGLLSIQNMNISLNLQGSSGQGGYAGEPQIYHMFGGPEGPYSPPFGYRIGLFNKISRDRLITNPDPSQSLSLRATQRANNQLNVRSGLRPVQDINVNLNWQISWSDTKTQQQTLFFDDSLAVQLEHSGDISTTVWAFGSGYDGLIDLQVDRTLSATPEDETNIHGLNDNQVPLTPGSLEQDFRKAYMSASNNTIGKRGYLPVPLPNWQVTWTGWEQRIGFLSNHIQRASINHSYQGRYRQGWQLNPNRGVDLIRPVGPYNFHYTQPDIHSRSIGLDQSFSPLIGLNLTWVNNLRTQIQYNKSKQITLSFSNTNISERKTQGVTATFGYSKRGFRVPLFRQLNNQIDMNIAVNYSESLTFTYRLNEDLGDAIQGLPIALPEERGDAQIQIRPSIKYQFSRAINAGFEYSFSRHIPKSSGTYPRTDQDIRFNVQVTIRSN
ncbi:MAG: cell surface protein SprA [Balneolales bacterium]